MGGACAQLGPSSASILLSSQAASIYEEWLHSFEGRVIRRVRSTIQSSGSQPEVVLPTPPLQGTFATSEDLFWFHNWRTCNQHLWVKSRDAAKYLTIHRTALHTKNHRVQNVSSAKMEKPQPIGRQQRPGSQFCQMWLYKIGKFLLLAFHIPKLERIIIKGPNLPSLEKSK